MKTKHFSGRKLLSLLLALMMLLSMLPLSAFAADSNQFALFAVDTNGQIIAPCYVSYTAGQTVKEALKGSGHTFEGIDDGYISAIDGNVGTYTVHFDDNNWDLSKPASDVTALWFTGNTTQAYGDHLLAAVKAMALFNASTNGVKKYAPAKTAYEAAVKGFYAADDASAEKLAADLNGAMKRYEDYLSGKPVSVKLDVTLGGNAVTADHVELTGEFGNVVKADHADTIQVIPGKYTYEITHETFRHARGTVEVSGPDVTITAQLPTGQWIKDVQLGLENNWEEKDKMVRTDATVNGATFQIPDYAEGRLYAYIEPGEGVDTHDIQLFVGNSDSARGWKSTTSATSGVYQPNSLEGNVFSYEARSQSNLGMYQTYTVALVRTPSLSDLKVVSSGLPLTLEFNRKTLTYEMSVTGDTVEITPTALMDQSKITVKTSQQDSGKAVKSGESVTVKLADCQQQDGAAHVYVQLDSPDHHSTQYHLVLKPTASADVTINHNTHSKVEVRTASGAVVAPKSQPSSSQSIYALIPGESYQCINTVDSYYHTSVKFTAKQGLSFDAPDCIRENWMTGLTVKPGASASIPAFSMTPDFGANTHEYTVTAESNTTSFYVTATAADKKLSIYADYLYHPGSFTPGKAAHQELRSGTSKPLSNFLAIGGVGNEVTLTLQKPLDASGKAYTDAIAYQNYDLHVNRQITLNAMSAADDNGNKLSLAPKFNKLTKDYTLELGQRVPQLQLTVKPLSGYKIDHDFKVKAVCGSWSQEIVYSKDLAPNVAQTVSVPLDTSKLSETVQLIVSHGENGSVPTTYTIAVTKLPSIKTTITTDPADAVIYLQDNSLKARVLPEADGSFILNTGISYTYYVTKSGYVGKTADFIAGKDTSVQNVALEKAPASTFNDISKPGDWHQFRADNNNNGVVNTKTPIKAEDTVLVWANKVGEGFDSGAVGCPIIVGGYIYTYAGTSIIKIDKETGEVVASGKMVASSSFAINSPTYADGMIFVGLSNGRVQAFNAVTLESLWVYSDSRKGQPNCPITYADGYIYTGFWNSERKEANFVCLSITDENPDETNETKLPTWVHTDKGFYWAGAYVSKNFVLVPTDDGENGYKIGHGDLLSLDPKDGHLIDKMTMPGVGDLRSSICYDETTDAYYFTSKGGDFYRVKVNADGTIVKNSLRTLHLDNDANNPEVPPMSTSTPVIYKGRAYIGVSGSGQFSAYSGHNMTVIDLNSFSIAYKVPTQGYPQVSGLLTTGYEDTGYIYVYFIDNFTPGKIRVIRDQPGRTAPDPEYMTKETYSSGGKEYTVDAGYVLFTPSDKQAQFAICSPIADAEGNLYFKNDSAHMMRLSSVITELEVTQQPQKTIYKVGQAFDGTGLAVTAHYANGATRDISQYLSYSTDPLTADDTEITISFDLNKLLNHKDQPEAAKPGHWMMYHDENGKDGVPYDLPTTSVNIQFTTEHIWDEGIVQSESTCTQPGKIVYTCTVCGETRTEDLPLAAHTLTHVDGKDATCTEDGTLDHYHCSVCQKNFADAEGEPELNSIVIPAKAHTLTHVDGKDATCTEDGILEHYHCSICQKNFADAEGKQELKSVVIPAKAHTLTHVDGKAATCTEDGILEHYLCSVCQKNFADAEGKQELKSIVIAALGHGKTEIRNAKKATTTQEGYTGDTYCTVCGEKLAEGEVIPKLEAPKPITPGTGDNTPIVLLSTVAACSLTAAAALYLLRKKKYTA